MPPNHSLLSSTLPPHLVGLHRFSQDAGQMLMRMGAFPLLLSELNQHGFARPEDLSLLLQHFLQIPLSEIRLSHTTPRNEETKFEVWQFDELEGLIRYTIDIEPLIFEECCNKPLHIHDFSDPSFMHIQTLAQQLFGRECSTYLNVPLHVQGHWLGVLHFSRSTAAPYNDGDYFIAQLLGQALALVLACGKLQEDQLHTQASAQEAEQQRGRAEFALSELEQAHQRLATLDQEQAQLKEALAKERQEKNELKRQLLETKEENSLLHGSLQQRSKVAPAGPQEATSSDYVAAPPPILSTGRNAPSQSNALNLPPVDSLREAFRPQHDDPGEVVLLEVIEEARGPVIKASETPIDLEDLEIETNDATKQIASTLLCLTAPPSDSLRSFARIIQSFDLRLMASPTIPELLSSHKLAPPMAIGLTSKQLKQNIGIVDTLQSYDAATQIPLFEASDDGDAELAIRLHWNQSATQFIKDTFWHNWLRKTRNPPIEDSKILVIGKDKTQIPLPIIDFFCGQNMALEFFDNPVDGIQTLYQAPPRLFVLELEEEQSHWVSLFTEMSRSARTLEMPILLLNHAEPQPEIWEVIQPFTFLQLSPADL